MKRSLRTHIYTASGLLATDAVFFAVSDPQRVPAYLLMLASLLVTVTVWTMVSLLVRLAQQQGLITHAHHRLRIMLTLLVGGLLALQSVNQLSSRDIAVTLPLVVLGYLYISYGRPTATAMASP